MSKRIKVFSWILFVISGAMFAVIHSSGFPECMATFTASYFMLLKYFGLAGMITLIAISNFVNPEWVRSEESIRLIILFCFSFMVGTI